MKSDKKARLYMCIDSELLAAMEVAAKKDGLSLEDEIEQILRRKAVLRSIIKICSRLSIKRRMLVLDYAKGLSDEEEAST